MHIAPEHLALLKRILSAHLPETEVWAFGSRVCSQPTPASDLDLVAFTDDDNALFLAQEALAESDLPFRVDLLQWSALPENMQQQIKQCYEILIQEPTHDRHETSRFGLSPQWPSGED